MGGDQLMFEVGNMVTLKESEDYDDDTKIHTDDVGEITDWYKDYSDGDMIRIYVIAFQELTDKEGVTPLVWKDASQLNLHQI
jgi:hypothetical protein